MVIVEHNCIELYSLSFKFIIKQHFMFQLFKNNIILIMMKMMMLIKNIMNIVINVIKEVILINYFVMNKEKLNGKYIYLFTIDKELQFIVIMKQNIIII